MQQAVHCQLIVKISESSLIVQQPNAYMENKGRIYLPRKKGDAYSSGLPGANYLERKNARAFCISLICRPIESIYLL